MANVVKDTVKRFMVPFLMVPRFNPLPVRVAQTPRWDTCSLPPGACHASDLQDWMSFSDNELSRISVFGLLGSCNYTLVRLILGGSH